MTMTKPFIRWCGGKTRVLPQIHQRLPAMDLFGVYAEPFVGGGAVFWSLQDKLKDHKIELSDSNGVLMRTYESIGREVENVIHELKFLHISGKGYYVVRDEINALHTGNSSYVTVSESARFLFLNKNCYNGLYRVNKDGEFNVPQGRYKTFPQPMDFDNLRECSKALNSLNVDFGYGDWKEQVYNLIDTYGPRLFLYLDPPYYKQFAKYTPGGFTQENHERLLAACIYANKMGAKFLLSNSNEPWVVDAYLHAGFPIDIIGTKKSISRDGADRGTPKTELLIRNY